MIKDTMLVIREKMGAEIYISDDELNVDSIIQLVHIFEKHIDDIRVKGRCIFNMHHLLIIVFLAIISGYHNCSEFVWFCKRRYHLLEKLGLLSDEIVPSHDTFRRILIILEPIQLQFALLKQLEFFFTQVEKQFDIKGKYVQMAIDGKELRGTGRTQTTQQPKRNLQTLNVYNITRGICMYSEAIDTKTNEIPVAQDILRSLELKKTILSADALHSQRETAKLIIERKGFYLFNIKDNQKLLKQEIINIFDKHQKKIKSYHEDNHKKPKNGTLRKYEIIRLWKTYIGEDWPDQKAYVRMTSANGKTYFFLTNIRENEVVIEAIENRWKIENDLHRYKDLLLHEDDIHYTNKNMANNLAVFNNLALAFINITQEIENLPTKKFTRKVLVMESESLPFKIIKIVGSKKLISQLT